MAIKPRIRMRQALRLLATAAMLCAGIGRTQAVPLEEVVIGIGERLTLSAAVDGEPTRWKASNDRVAVVSVRADGTATILGMKQGRTRLSSDGRSAAYRVRVVPKTIRILAIGNSFLEDALEHYFRELARAAGIEVVVGNLHIGGCSLERHLSNARSDAPAYSYRKTGRDGSRIVRKGTSLREALCDEAWDYVSLQQVSYLSGIYATWEESLPALAEYVRSQTKAANPCLLLHQTWAYAENSKHTRFGNYDRSQMKMYRAIVDCVGRAAARVGIDLVVPCGTAIQNGRSSSLGDTFCRDGFHLERTYGRYTAACTWFEQLFNRPVVGIPYAPPQMPEHSERIAKLAAHRAVEHPTGVTDMGAY